MAGKQSGPGRGWHGDSAGHARVGSLGGQKSGGNFKRDPARARQAAKKSSGNFAQDRERARAAGARGGSK